MSDWVYNVLFICTRNSARSIMAEGILNRMGRRHFRAFSAGSHPDTAVNPFALKTLAALDIPIDGYRSKNWDEFAQPGALTGYACAARTSRRRIRATSRDARLSG